MNCNFFHFCKKLVFIALLLELFFKTNFKEFIMTKNSNTKCSDVVRRMSFSTLLSCTHLTLLTASLHHKRACHVSRQNFEIYYNLVVKLH